MFFDGSHTLGVPDILHARPSFCLCQRTLAAREPVVQSATFSPRWNCEIKCGSKEPMPAEHSIPEEKPQRTVIIVVAVIAAVLIGGIFYLLMRQTAAPVSPTSLAGAIRAGSPEFEQYRSKIILETSDEANQSTNVLGGFQMVLETNVRNLTGKTITGLELRGAILKSDGSVLKDRVVVVVPTAKNPELLPNKTMFVTIPISGIKESDDRAKLWVEVTGFTLQK